MAIKAITSIPGWSETLEQADKVSDEGKSYAMVPLIYRAVKLRSDALSSVPVNIHKGETETEWPFDVELEELIWKTEAAMLLSGAGYWLKNANTVRVMDVQWLNPFSVEVEYDGDFSFMQYAGTRTNGPWTLDDIVYFREWDPYQDTNPGVSAAGVALGDSRLLNYITRFGYHFFDGGAMPVTVLGLAGSVNDTELKRTESAFKRMMTNIKNAFRVIGVRADQIDIKTLTPPLEELALPELYDQARGNVGAAFGIPTSMMEEPSANRATADTHYMTFWRDTVRPRGKLFENTINRQLLKPLGLELSFSFDEMDVFQTDEAQRAGSLLNYVQAGYSPALASQVLGVDLTEEQIAELRATEADNVIQDMPITQENEPKSSAGDGMRTDLSKWHRKAEKRLKNGSTPAVGFESEYIPATLNAAIMGALEGVKTVEGLATVFESAEAWKAYP
jgi:HK97 family phage portal protein